MRSFVNLTDGGLAIDENFNVLGANDEPITALYAAGSAGQGGIVLEGHGHLLGWAFTSGRLAGATRPTASAPRILEGLTWFSYVEANAAGRHPEVRTLRASKGDVASRASFEAREDAGTSG